MLKRALCRSSQWLVTRMLTTRSRFSAGSAVAFSYASASTWCQFVQNGPPDRHPATRFHFSSSKTGCFSVTDSLITAGARRCASSQESYRWHCLTTNERFLPLNSRLQWNYSCMMLQHVRSFHLSCNGGLLLSPRTRRGQLLTAEDACNFVDSLSVYQRACLEKAMMKKEMKESVEKAPPTWPQLRLLSYQQAIPFIGFGFLDNFVMITVGGYIDLSIGAVLTISTMAAAGFGNLISDLAGLGLADQVEALCRRIGIPNPHLSSAQLQHRASRWMGLMGRCMGISLGCILGMIPLFWFDHSRKEQTKQEVKRQPPL